MFFGFYCYTIYSSVSLSCFSKSIFCFLNTGQKGQTTVCMYDNIKSKLLVDLIDEYSQITNTM